MPAHYLPNAVEYLERVPFFGHTGFPPTFPGDKGAVHGATFCAQAFGILSPSLSFRRRAATRRRTRSTTGGSAGPRGVLVPTQSARIRPPATVAERVIDASRSHGALRGADHTPEGGCERRPLAMNPAGMCSVGVGKRGLHVIAKRTTLGSTGRCLVMPVPSHTVATGPAARNQDVLEDRNPAMNSHVNVLIWERARTALDTIRDLADADGIRTPDEQVAIAACEDTVDMARFGKEAVALAHAIERPALTRWYLKELWGRWERSAEELATA